MVRHEAVTLARSYVQTVNVEAQKMIATKNKSLVKGWTWNSAAENGHYYSKKGGSGRGICLMCLSLGSKKIVYPIDGGPIIPLHPRCRCVRHLVTKTWKELGVDALVKATKVDGVFDSDPMLNPNAVRYDRLTYAKVLEDRLGVMDLSAISMCMENDIRILVLQLSKPGNLLNAVCGQEVGTIVTH